MRDEDRLILSATTITAFMTPFMGSSINLAIPAMGLEFSGSVLLLSWIVSAYLLTSALFIVPMGRFADMRGRWKVFEAGIMLFALSSLICMLAPSAAVLILGRIVQGIGSAMIFATAVAIIAVHIPREHRGYALGINVAGVYLGTTLGPFLGGFLTEYFGWRSLFLFTIIISVIAMAMTLHVAKGFMEEKSAEKFDTLGSVIYAAMILSAMLAVSIISQASIPLFIAAVILFAAFYRHELRHENPVFQIKLFRGNKRFTYSNLAALINYSSTFAIGFFFSIYLQTVRGFDPMISGMLLISQPVFQMIFSIYIGKLSDKYDSGMLAAFGMGLITVSLITFIFITADTPVWILMIALCITGIGYGCFSAPNTHTVMDSVEDRSSGVASGVLSTMRVSGMMISMALASLGFSIGVGSAVLAEADHAALVSSINLGFILFFFLGIIGTCSALISYKSPKRA